jgi:hypothetical protein
MFNNRVIIPDKNPDDKHFENGPKERHIWEADDSDETYRNDTGMFTHINSHVKFDTPKVPVIFVLGKCIHLNTYYGSDWVYNYLHVPAGGPGSGKVTHCDNLMIEKRGIVHINMTDLLQQYTVGNGKFKIIIL